MVDKLLCDFNLQFATLPFRWPFWLHILSEFGTYSLNIAAVCYFALVFPNPHPLVKRFPLLVPLLIYLSHPVFIVVSMVLSPSYNTALQVGNITSWAVAIVQLGLAQSAGLRSVATARDPVARAQIRWIVWSASIVGA